MEFLVEKLAVSKDISLGHFKSILGNFRFWFNGNDKLDNSWLNPIVLKTAKTQWSFGHSECNRVKSQFEIFKTVRHKYLQPMLFFFFNFQ